MTEQRQREIRDEEAREQLAFLNACGGALEAGKKAKLEGDIAVRHKNACEAASKHADKNGKVDPNIQAIFARMYGLI